VAIPLLKDPAKAGPYSLTKTFFRVFFSLYVGIVPEGDLMAIFVCDWRCKFLLMFLFVVTSFGRPPGEPNYVLVFPKLIYQNFVQLPFSAMLLGLSILQI
jgi:hypothetical protein